MNEIIKIKISEIDAFKNHPYKVELGDELNDLVESIKLNGLLVPIVVRRKENDRYELLSGHRRKKVYEILGLDHNNTVQYITRRKIVENLTFEKEATIKIENNIDKMFMEISTRNARFENMTIDEKIKEIANLIENLLYVDGNYIKLDYSKHCFEYVDDEIIKKYRKQIQCFRHSSNNALEEKKQFSDEEKEFIIDYGITIIKLIYSFK